MVKKKKPLIIFSVGPTQELGQLSLTTGVLYFHFKNEAYGCV